MKDVEKICRLALVQAEPCMFDKKASVEKTVKYIMTPPPKTGPTSSFFRSFLSPATR